MALTPVASFSRMPPLLPRASWCAFQSEDHFRAHARMTLTGLFCCSGRKVALLSASKMKVPPGLMAIVSMMRSLSSHATTQAWLHSPSTKRMTLPTGPAGPGGPAGPASPASPFAPLIVLGASEQLPNANAAVKTTTADHPCRQIPPHRHAGEPKVSASAHPPTHKF